MLRERSAKIGWRLRPATETYMAACSERPLPVKAVVESQNSNFQPRMTALRCTADSHQISGNDRIEPNLSIFDGEAKVGFAELLRGLKARS